MKLKDILKRYMEDPQVGVIAESLKPNEDHAIQVRGLKGSLDAFLCAALYRINPQNQLYILENNEQAAYFFDDLQNILGNTEVLFYPMSYKKPYQFEDVENANVLRRAEILNRLNNRGSKGEIIVTYPEALTEKVITKRALSQNTYSISLGEEIVPDEVREQLNEFGFELNDFVYEPGQYAIRGGIIDIFSYSNELPYRMELFGNEIDSIRTFDPETQLSIDKIKRINLLPNIQENLVSDDSQSFLSFIPRNTKIWIKDMDLLLDVIDRMYSVADDHFAEVVRKSGDIQLISSPAERFENRASFSEGLSGFVRIEFGNRFSSLHAQKIEYLAAPQPEFHKNFELMADALEENQFKNIENIIAAENPQQLDRLNTILEEIRPGVKFHGLNLGLRKGFIDRNTGLCLFTDHQIFDRFHRYKVKKSYSKSRAITIKELNTLKPGDYVTHIDYGVGRFAGLEKVDVNGNEQESVRIVYRDDDLLYLSIHSLHKISRYSGGETEPPSMSKLGSADWENKKKRVKKKLQDIADDLIKLYAKRKEAPGFAFTRDSFMQAELESSFFYEDTPDQATATVDVKNDMELPHPMDRLICGDVGFGKTEIAIRAAFKAVNDGKQVAVLVPTTILAMQHFHTFSNRLTDFPVTVEYINRFKSAKEIKEITTKLEAGQIDIIIGTHRLVNKSVRFKDLGLMIIDEEQKFGVKVKEKLKEMRVGVDALTLTATPIPRTLHFSLMGARDLSIISTPPPNRRPVVTELISFDEGLIRDAISFELRRGGQVFFVHNRVRDIDEVANMILKLVPEASIGVAHGQMEGQKLEKVMLRFIEGGYDVLVSTNIIESGLDIPNANTIIINQAHMFGLSDLHQMRGRVGRSNKKAFCYLLTSPSIRLTLDARKRLRTLEEFSDLGDGFKVAMRDLDIRGAGNLLGAEQSGFITDLGFDAYHKILDEAVQELKETKFRDLFETEITDDLESLVQDCIIETDLEIIIPETYVANTAERLRIYSEIDNIKSEEELEKFRLELVDRFGKIPESVEDLLDTVRLRWLAESLGFEKLVLKSGKMRGMFLPPDREKYYQSDVFGKILAYVQQNPRRCRLIEGKNKLTLAVSSIERVQEAIDLLKQMKGSL